MFPRMTMFGKAKTNAYEWALKQTITEGKDIKTSGTGQHMVALSDHAYPRISSNFGETWASVSAAGYSDYWAKVAMSASGAVILLAPLYPAGYIRASFDFGATWGDLTAAGSREWRAVCVSADGAKIFAAASGSLIYYSTNAGASFGTRATPSASSLVELALAPDCSLLVLNENPGFLFTSTDEGANWTQRTFSYISWRSASAAPGGLIVATAGGSDARISTDYGATFSDHALASTDSVVSSDGGMIAVPNTSDCKTTIDGGASWVTSNPTVPIQAIASTADGGILAGIASSGIYLAVTS